MSSRFGHTYAHTEKTMKVKITTTIDIEQYKIIKKNNWKISQVLDAGVVSLINPQIMQEKLGDQNKIIEDLKKSIQYLRGKVSAHDLYIEKEVENGN